MVFLAHLREGKDLTPGGLKTKQGQIVTPTLCAQNHEAPSKNHLEEEMRFNQQSNLLLVEPLFLIQDLALRKSILHSLE